MRMSAWGSVGYVSPQTCVTSGDYSAEAFSLGGSGSGKTTLLNAIAHRLSGLPTESGEVSYYSFDPSLTPPFHLQSRSSHLSHPSSSLPANATGEKVRRSQVKKRIGFVRQQDFLVECLTVRETLTYAARLRLPRSLGDDQVRQIVEETIDELGLRDAAETVVGGPLRKGISGGEKRRLTIGCVLVTLPSVLILDVGPPLANTEALSADVP